MGKILKLIDDLPILDAKKSIKLIVTAKTVAGSNPKKPDTCALAQACLARPGVKEVRIHLSRAYVRSNDLNWQRYFVSPQLRTEIVAFDRGGKFAPGEYTLSKIRSSKTLGKRTGSKKLKHETYAERKKRESRRGKPRPYHVVTDVRSGPA